MLLPTRRIVEGNVCLNDRNQIGVVRFVNYPCSSGACESPILYGDQLDGEYWWATGSVTKLAETREEYTARTAGLESK